LTPLAAHDRAKSSHPRQKPGKFRKTELSQPGGVALADALFSAFLLVFFQKLPILKIIKHVAIPKSAVCGENLLENQPKSNMPDGG
jgi:hypothetical protein